MGRGNRMSDWSDTRNITGQDVGSGVFWKPEKPSWNLPSFGKDPLPAAPQQQRLSRDFNQANEFVALLRKEGPRTAYTAPAYQLPLDIPESTYPRRLRTQYYDVGYVIIQIDNAGEVYIRPRRMRIAKLYPKEYLCPLG